MTTNPSKHSTLLLSLTIAFLSVIACSAAAQSTNTSATTTTPTQTKSAAPPKAGAAQGPHETVEYKDPEDMTTRYRPGNNKTTNAPAASTTSAPATTQAGTTATTTDAKKHVTNVKYADGKTTVPSLDASSKDAAKAKTAPSPGSTTGKQGASTTQDSQHVNKVDSFTVKQ